MENKLLLNRYRLSHGGNGLPVELHRTPTSILYRGQELESGRELAIELVPLTSTDPVALEQLEAAANAAKKISHINIPTLYDFGIDNGQLVYVTEYFDGHTAEAWVAARGPLPTTAVLRVAVQIADALRVASFQRLSHRSLCPANIVFLPNETALGEWPTIKVLHWLGLPPNFAETAEGDARLTTAVHFASPEQLRREKVGSPSATYSLGCSMWFLLTGTLPAAAAPALKATTAAPVDVDKLRGVPKIVRHLLGRMLRPDPVERPQDPVALSAVLQTCLARAERREAINCRLGFPADARARVVEAGTARRWPTQPLAVAAALLVFATLAAVAVPRYFHPRTKAQANTPLTKISSSGGGLENFPARTMTNAPRQKSKATLPDVAANSELRRSQIPAETKILGKGRGEAMTSTNNTAGATPSPLRLLAGATGADAAVRKTTDDAMALESESPSEGPKVAAASTSTILQESFPEEEAPAKRALTQPQEGPVTASSGARLDFLAGGSRAIAETAANPPPVADPGSAAQSTTATKTKESNLAEKVSPQGKATTRAVAAKSTSRKKKVRTPPKVAHTSVRKRSRVVHTARRAQKHSLLHIGAARADLVGTADGKWIVAVSPANHQVILWPPPGFR